MNRIDQLDGLRGLFIILITINHIESPLTAFTYQPLGYVSAAEGFVFLSGLVAGLVYYRRLETRGFAKAFKNAFKRARTIYKYHILALLTVCVVGYVSVIHQEFWAKLLAGFLQNPVQAFTLGLLLLYQPDFFDILPMYCIFLIALPFLLYQFRQNRSRWVLTGSVLLWIVSQIGLGLSYKATYHAQRILPTVEFSYMDIFAWQLLFVAGAYIAYRRASGNEIRLPRYCAWISVLVVGLLTLNRFHLLGTTDDLWWNLIDKHRLGPLRVLNFAALIVLFQFLMQSYRSLFAQPWLVILGKHSLQVFSLHIILIFLLLPLVALYSDNNPMAYVAFAGFVLLCLYVVAWSRERIKQAKKQPAMA